MEWAIVVAQREIGPSVAHAWRLFKRAIVDEAVRVPGGEIS